MVWMNRRETKGVRYTRFETLPVDSDKLRAFSHNTKVMPISNNPIYMAASMDFVLYPDRLLVARASTKIKTRENKALINNLATSSLLSFRLIIQKRDQITEENSARAMPAGSLMR
jgi:hypothetical protein